MKVSLARIRRNEVAYGLYFDEDGVVEVEKYDVQSLLDAGKMVVIEDAKPVKAPSKAKK
tara:strand:+ start:467 stop:643 length:177 start_codon:yes stop_codon:yes gene_type:complete